MCLKQLLIVFSPFGTRLSDLIPTLAKPIFEINKNEGWYDNRIYPDFLIKPLHLISKLILTKLAIRRYLSQKCLTEQQAEVKPKAG